MLSVVMPAHNERNYLAAAVAEVVSGLWDRAVAFELIVCENGSSDGTAEVAADLARHYPEVRVVTSPVADYGAALRQGFLEAGGDVVVNFDVDFVDLSFLDAAVTLVRSDGGPAIVVGSKRGPGAVDTRRVGRRIVTATFSLVLQLGFGLSVSDTHGIKALRRADLAPLVEACRSGADLFDTELILRAERAGLRVAELPVTVRDRRPPRSSIARRMVRSSAGLVRLKMALRQPDRPPSRLAGCRSSGSAPG